MPTNKKKKSFLWTVAQRDIKSLVQLSRGKTLWINNAESADSSIIVYLAMTHYWSILWPQIPPLAFHPVRQKAFHLSCYRTWPRQRFPLSCSRQAKREHSLLSIQIHPEVLSGRTKIIQFSNISGTYLVYQIYKKGKIYSFWKTVHLIELIMQEA